jgi:hypothetical protein
MKIVAGKPEGKRPPGRWLVVEDTVTLDLKEIVCDFVDWIHLAQDVA